MDFISFYLHRHRSPNRKERKFDLQEGVLRFRHIIRRSKEENFTDPMAPRTWPASEYRRSYSGFTGCYGFIRRRDISDKEKSLSPQPEQLSTKGKLRWEAGN